MIDIPPLQAGPLKARSSISSRTPAGATWRHRTGSRPAAFHASFWPARSLGCLVDGLCSTDTPEQLPTLGAVPPESHCLLGASAHVGVPGGPGSWADCEASCAALSVMRCSRRSRMRGQSLHEARHSQSAPAAC